jgi:hypothetical protein
MESFSLGLCVFDRMYYLQKINMFKSIINVLVLDDAEGKKVMYTEIIRDIYYFNTVCIRVRLRSGHEKLTHVELWYVSVEDRQ